MSDVKTGFVADNELIARRLEKAELMRAQGVNPYANNADVSHTVQALFGSFGEATKDELEAANQTVTVAGRVRFKRVMGKASFLKIQDWTVRPGIKPPGMKEDGERPEATDDFLQLYLKKDHVGEDGHALVKDLDLGDFVAVTGTLMRTRTGELTVGGTSIHMLTKSIRPLPDKWHGLSDVEQRFRQRYVDFAMNSEAREVLRTRAEVIRLTRSFFHERGYLEVETPILHPTPGGAAARPFETHHNALDVGLYLRIAPELYLKRLLVGGLGRVFELGRVFRNEGLSRKHNPEFTMVEFYEAYATFEDLMDLTEELVSGLVQTVRGATVVEYAGHTIDFARPWARLTVAEAVAKYTDTPVDSLADREVLLALAKAHDVADAASLSDAKLLMEVYEATAEDRLVQPTFVTHYPAEVSPLSRRNEADPNVVDRFELIVAGSELANAFSELNDPVDQYERFEKQLEAKAAGDHEAHPMDRDYVRALEYGMPPAAGQGIGIDRLVMILTDAPNIREVIAFPQMRPEHGTPDPADDESSAPEGGEE